MSCLFSDDPGLTRETSKKYIYVQNHLPGCWYIIHILQNQATLHLTTPYYTILNRNTQHCTTTLNLKDNVLSEAIQEALSVMGLEFPEVRGGRRGKDRSRRRREGAGAQEKECRSRSP